MINNSNMITNSTGIDSDINSKIGEYVTGDSAFTDSHEEKEKIAYEFTTQKTWPDLIYMLSKEKPKRSLLYISILLPLLSIYLFFYFLGKTETTQIVAYYIFSTTFIIYPAYILIIYCFFYRKGQD
ncbi:hypothetical protein [Francisella philomiragia]|uniref:hypothetical protein n=1 Tax=Francisella philomiragia TaxID=28110 RepID=UPI001C9DED66|nr:hypothetical protein [Francisella philomiragia]MBY7735054.1 hypothetical protein [Francisella philomiragia]